MIGLAVTSDGRIGETMVEVPAWTWALGVCLLAWSFRRLALHSGIALMGGISTPAARPTFSLGRAHFETVETPIPRSDARVPNPGTETPEVGVERVSTWISASRRARVSFRNAGSTLTRGVLARLWSLLRRNRAQETRIQIIGRRALGPRQQIVVTRVWETEYALLFGDGAVPVVLDKRRIGKRTQSQSRRELRERPAVRRARSVPQ